MGGGGIAREGEAGSPWRQPRGLLYPAFMTQISYVIYCFSVLLLPFGVEANQRPYISYDVSMNDARPAL